MTKYIEAFGESKSIAKWSRDRRISLGLSYEALRDRLHGGMSPEEAITKPPKIKYKHNHNYFQDWTHENAWIIGFITADGCINGNGLHIALSEKDRSVLEHIKDKLSTCNIECRWNVSPTYNDRTYKQAMLRIHSKQMVNSLIRYNIVPQKTGKEKLPEFPNKEVGYRYLLGLIDGDGSIGCYKRRGSLNVYDRSLSLYSASRKFLEEISLYFGIGNVNYGDGCHRLQVYQQNKLTDLYHNLYDSGGFCLQRKKDKFTQILQSYGENI